MRAPQSRGTNTALAGHAEALSHRPASRDVGREPDTVPSPPNPGERLPVDHAHPSWPPTPTCTEPSQGQGAGSWCRKGKGPAAPLTERAAERHPLGPLGAHPTSFSVPPPGSLPCSTKSSSLCSWEAQGPGDTAQLLCSRNPRGELVRTWKRWTKKQTLRTCSSGARSGHLITAPVHGPPRRDTGSQGAKGSSPAAHREQHRARGNSQCRSPEASMRLGKSHLRCRWGPAR